MSTVVGAGGIADNKKTTSLTHGAHVQQISDKLVIKYSMMDVDYC